MDDWGREGNPFRGMTGKQVAFVESYVQCWNATEAARAAGYQGANDNVFAVIGWENLRKPKIKRAIQVITQANAMLASEALGRLARMARGSLSDFMTRDPQTNQWKLDLTKAGNRGAFDLIKSITFQGDRVQRIELYDAKDALKLIGQALELFDGGISITLPVFDPEAWRQQAEQRLNEAEAIVDIYEDAEGEDNVEQTP